MGPRKGCRTGQKMEERFFNSDETLHEDESQSTLLRASPHRSSYGPCAELPNSMAASQMSLDGDPILYASIVCRRLSSPTKRNRQGSAPPRLPPSNPPTRCQIGGSSYFRVEKPAAGACTPSFAIINQVKAKRDIEYAINSGRNLQSTNTRDRSIAAAEFETSSRHLRSLIGIPVSIFSGE